MQRSISYPQEVFGWMIGSMQMVALYYGAIPVKELYKVFQGGKDMFPGHDGAPGVADIGEQEYAEMLHRFLSIANRPDLAGTPGLEAAGITCKFDRDELIMTGADDIVKDIRYKKFFIPDDYYILSLEEVMQVLDKGYIERPATRGLEYYLSSRWNKSEKEAADIVHSIVRGFQLGKVSPEDTVNKLIRTIGADTKDHSIETDELTEICHIVSQVYNQTGGMDQCGWSPVQIYEKTTGKKAPEVKSKIQDDPNAFQADFSKKHLGPTVTRESSQIISILKKYECELEKLGVNVDHEVNAYTYQDMRVTPEGTVHRAHSKKINRNDPCPCGSGLKYKNCHGR